LERQKEEGKVYYSKYDLKTELLKEQNNLCCYCNVEIKNDRKTPIEHLKPKGTYKHLTFEYKNLMASCSGNQRDNDGKKKEPKPRILHCDAGKKGDEIDLTPLMKECETEIIYAENGGITDDSERAKQTIKTLNLGCKKLMDERKEKILGFLYEDEFNTKKISELEAEKIYNTLSKTKSEPYIIAILQVLQQNFSTN